MSDPMPTIIDTLRGAAAIHKAEAQDRRADLVGMFERHADWHDGKAWIPVETAADLVVDREAEIVRAAKVEALREAANDAEKAAADWRRSAADPMNPSSSAEWDRCNAEYRESAARGLRTRATSIEAGADS